MAALACLLAVAGESPAQPASSPPDADVPGKLTSRNLPAKPTFKVINPLIHDSSVIVVKFRDDLRVRAQQGVLTDSNTGDLNPAKPLLQQLAGATWRPSHSLPEQRLDQLRANAQQNLRRAVADLNTQFNLSNLPPNVDPVELLNAFNALEIVELAVPMSVPHLPPVPPDFEPMQGYLDPATDGINARTMWEFPGGTGAGFDVVDIEYSWNFNHQDLPPVTLLGGAPTDPFNDNNHGTAVLGELVSLRNGWGTTGICYDVNMFVAAANVGGTYDLSAAITTALAQTGAGEFILIEQQTAGPNFTGIPMGTQFGLVPSEWDSNVYNAIVLAVGNGVIVVEAAGNGSQNLDAPEYNAGHAPFLPANDSGAIIVGAGAAPSGSDVDRSRLDFSCYGVTVDLQGWGESVMTTGYGFFYDLEGVDLWYRSSFGGTSSASPIVTGAGVLLQSTYFAQTGALLSPAQIRDTLRATGSPQQDGSFPTSQNIGPRPNVLAALALAIGNQPPVALCQPFAAPGDGDCCITVNVADIDAGSNDPDGANVPAPTICITAVDGNPVNCASSVQVCGLGFHVVELTITDAFGESDSCIAGVTVQDNTVPVITCSITNPVQPILLDANCQATVFFTATVTDNCCINPSDVVFTPGGVNVTASDLALDPLPPKGDVVTITGRFTVSALLACPAFANLTVNANDCAGNAAAPCNDSAEVRDPIPPVLTCPPPLTLERGDKLCNTDVDDWLNSATATDNCDTNISIVNDSAPNGFACGFPCGSTTTVTWTATDDCGNTDQCSSTITILPCTTADSSRKGSLLVWPDVDLKWNVLAGGVIQPVQDTFITLSNDIASSGVRVKLFFVNGDPPIPAFGPGTGSIEPGWNFLDAIIDLTHDHPRYWSMLTGRGSTGQVVPPLRALDSDGRDDPANPGGRRLRGFVIGFAIHVQGNEIRWNHLRGLATTVNYAENSAWEYEAWAYANSCVAHGAEPLDCTQFDANGVCCAASVIPGRLDMDGFQYHYNPLYLVLDFFSSGSTAFFVNGIAGPPGAVDTQVTLLPMIHDFTPFHPPEALLTDAQVDVWNGDEVKMTNLHKCIQCWDGALMSAYPIPNHFLFANMGTQKGKARFRGREFAGCNRPPNPYAYPPDPGLLSQTAPILGVSHKIMTRVGGAVLRAGAPMSAAGFRSDGRILFVPQGDPPEAGWNPLDDPVAPNGPAATPVQDDGPAN